MNKKIPLPFLLFISLVLILSGCLSDGEGEEYLFSSPEEVIDGWINGIYEDDFDKLLSTYWPDVQGEFFPVDDDPVSVSGLDEMAEYLDDYFDDIYDRLDYEYPEIFWGEPVDDSSVNAYIYYQPDHLGESFTLTRQGDFWAIRQQNLSKSSRGSEKIRGKRLAVVDIESLTSRIDGETEKGLLLFVENSFVNSGKVTVVDRKSIEKIIDEYKFQSTGLTDEKTAVEIGKLAGAEIIVLGSLTNVGSKYYLQIRLIDVKTAEVVASGLSEAQGEDDFLEMSRRVVDEFF